MKDIVAIFSLLFCSFVAGDNYEVTIPQAPGGYVEVQTSGNYEHEHDPRKPIPTQWDGPVDHDKEAFGNAHSVEKHGYPPGCANSEENYKCDYMVTINLDSEGYPGQAYFKLSGKLDKVGHGYVAVGLSEDDKMGDDHIVECIKRKDKTHPLIYHSWSQYHQTPQRLKDDSELIHMIKTKYDEETGYLTCEFTRPILSSVKYQSGRGLEKVKKFDMVHDQYYVLLATGQLKAPTSEDIGFHGAVSFGHAYVSRHPYKGYHRSSSPSISYKILLIMIPLLTLTAFLLD